MTAKELLIAYLENIADPEKAVSFFAPDGAVELPYLKSLNLPWRAEGPEEIRGFLANLLDMVPDYTMQAPAIHIDTPTQVFAEYSVSATTRDGRPFVQHYGGRLEARDGKITLLREFMDLVHAARAILPNGTADIPR
jgi:ketosteroid isomerase-like protein